MSAWRFGMCGVAIIEKAALEREQKQQCDQQREDAERLQRQQSED
jgi:hypothetical protein